jgi:hypothetical protein
VGNTATWIIIDIQPEFVVYGLGLRLHWFDNSGFNQNRRLHQSLSL